MAGSVKEISSSITPDVWLKIGQLAWSRLPQAMRTRIQAALDALTGIRADIARAARVQTMPLIEVVAELWRNDTDDATIDGRMKPVRRHGQEFLGIQLPIQTLLCDDNRVLRAVTVHEFSHCFWLAWTVLDASDAGLTKIDDDPNFDPTNAEHDESQMVIPSQWFGEVDAASFAYHHDVANGKVLHRSFRNLVGVFPIKTPDPRYQIQRPSIDDDICTHVRSLRNGPCSGGAIFGFEQESVGTRVLLGIGENASSAATGGCVRADRSGANIDRPFRGIPNSWNGRSEHLQFGVRPKLAKGPPHSRGTGSIAPLTL